MRQILPLYDKPASKECHHTETDIELGSEDLSSNSSLILYQLSGFKKNLKLCVQPHIGCLDAFPSDWLLGGKEGKTTLGLLITVYSLGLERNNPC